MTGLINNEENFQVIAARAILLNKNNEILMVAEENKKWHLPGGWIDTMEDPHEACTREVKEETGLDIVATKVIYVSHYIQQPSKQFLNYVQKFDLYFLCELINPDQQLDPDWQDPDNNLVKFRKFFNNEEWQDFSVCNAPKALKKLNLAEISQMPSCYTKI